MGVACPAHLVARLVAVAIVGIDEAPSALLPQVGGAHLARVTHPRHQVVHLWHEVEVAVGHPPCERAVHVRLVTHGLHPHLAVARVVQVDTEAQVVLVAVLLLQPPEHLGRGGVGLAVIQSPATELPRVGRHRYDTPQDTDSELIDRDVLPRIVAHNTHQLSFRRNVGKVSYI